MPPSQFFPTYSYLYSSLFIVYPRKRKAITQEGGWCNRRLVSWVRHVKKKDSVWRWGTVKHSVYVLSWGFVLNTGMNCRYLKHLQPLNLNPKRTGEPKYCKMLGFLSIVTIKAPLIYCVFIINFCRKTGINWDIKYLYICGIKKGQYYAFSHYLQVYMLQHALANWSVNQVRYLTQRLINEVINGLAWCWALLAFLAAILNNDCFLNRNKTTWSA